jgi:hypothetical protein
MIRKRLKGNPVVMTLDDILGQLREVDTELAEDEQTSARKILLDEVLSASDVDLPALTAAVHEKGRSVDPNSSDISEEALAEFGLLAEVSEAINSRVASIQDQRERDKRAAHAAKLAERIASTKVLDNEPAEQVAASSLPAVRSSGGREVVHAARRETVTMVAASDMPGFFSGQSINDMSQLAAGVISRARSLSRSGSGRQVPVATFQRQAPETHVISDEMRDWHRLASAADERRLPGGSLAASLLKRQSQITASTPVPPGSGGYAWCAPMEFRDEPCDVEGSLDALLDIPTIVTTRGGVMWPATPDFSDLYQPFCFSDQDVHGGYDIEKPCVQLPCPDGWDECRLQGCSLCLETGILQARIDPSQVERAITELTIAHQRHLNRMRIQSMVDQIAAIPGAHVDMTDWGSHGPGLIESLLSFVELQAERIRTRRRLPVTTTLEAVFPRYALGVLRSDLSKKNAIQGRWALGETDVITYLLSRGIRPQFVWDWQDEYIGGDSAVTEWPDRMTFMMYKAGAFTAIAGPSVQLEMIHDKALLQQNREIRLFAEDLWCVIHRCGPVASFTVPLCPNGLSGGQVNDGPCPPPVPEPAAALALNAAGVQSGGANR